MILYEFEVDGMACDVFSFAVNVDLVVVLQTFL